MIRKISTYFDITLISFRLHSNWSYVNYVPVPLCALLLTAASKLLHSWLVQLERGHTVSMHLRSNWTKSKYRDFAEENNQEVSEVLLRAISRQYGDMMGWLKLEGDLGWIQDVSGLENTALSKKADERFAAGRDFIASMLSRFQVHCYRIDLLACHMKVLRSSSQRVHKLRFRTQAWETNISIACRFSTSSITYVQKTSS